MTYTKKEQYPMSLSSLNTSAVSENGTAVEILHPTKNIPLGITFFIRGTDSKTFRDITRKQQNRRMEAAKKARGSLNLTAEEMDAESIEVLVACTASWKTGHEDTIEISDGEFLECTPDNSRRIYADPGFAWLREQVDREIGDRSNFLKP
jgi:hypothetical protein